MRHLYWKNNLPSIVASLLKGTRTPLSNCEANTVNQRDPGTGPGKCSLGAVDVKQTMQPLRQERSIINGLRFYKQTCANFQITTNIRLYRLPGFIPESCLNFG